MKLFGKAYGYLVCLALTVQIRMDMFLVTDWGFQFRWC